MPIRVKQDDRVRATGSVLLLTDLVNMNNYWKHPEVKTLSKERLEPYRDHPCARAARELDPCASMGSSFYCYAVLLEGPEQEFRPRPQAASFDGKYAGLRFSGLLRDFYRDAGLARFWDETKKLWDETLEDCRAMLAEEDPGKFLDLFYGASEYGRPKRDLVVVPNPLNPTSFSYGPGDGTTSYSIVGPPNVRLDSPDPVRYTAHGHQFQDGLFHEFSHTLLDVAESEAAGATDSLVHAVRGMPFNKKFADLYEEPDRHMCFDELFIRAATALYQREAGREAAAGAFLQRQEDEYGLGWIRRMHSALEAYLGGRKTNRYASLADYLPVLAATFSSV
jgi:hypothetical protein